MQRCRQGFTLIELSIVLVVIGLIVGGILVGQDLIKAAQIRGAIASVEKIKTAVNTFRIKYNGLPGDLPYKDAQATGLFAFSGGNAGTAGFGDGNGQVNGGAGAVNCSQEALVFWRHLGEANLIDGQFGITGNAALDANGNNTGNVTSADMNQMLPAMRLGQTNYFTVMYGNAGGNFPFPTAGYLVVFGMSSAFAGGVACAGNFTMTPLEANNIDSKLDDGKPNSGAVTATFASFTTAPASGNCTYNGASMGDLADLYNVNPATGGDVNACDMWFRL